MKLGPVLHFRGQSADSIRYDVVTVTAGAPPVVRGPEGVLLSPSAEYALGDGLRWWRFEFEVTAAPIACRHHYEVNGDPFSFWTPGNDDTLHLAYASCNGDARERRSALPRPGRNRLWSQVSHLHGARPFHLMVHGGDQVYADRVWRQIRRHSRRHYRNLPQVLTRYYVERYLWLWGQPEIAAVLASVPSIMCWDDHDIFDGWGSRPCRGVPEDIVREVFRAAYLTCSLFQRGHLPVSSPAPLHWQGRLGHTGVIALDVRTERTPEQVLSARGMAFLSMALEALRECPQVLVLSSTPLAGFDVAPIERALQWFGVGRLMPSDIRDQWSSPVHLPQWQQVAGLLFTHMARYRTQISVLSGEIHHGARTLMQRDDKTIHQFISSGIAHRPTGLPITRILDRLTRRGWAHGDIRVRPQALDDRGHTLLPSENWMSLDVAPNGVPLAHWYDRHASRQPASMAALGRLLPSR